MAPPQPAHQEGGKGKKKKKKGEGRSFGRHPISQPAFFSTSGLLRTEGKGRERKEREGEETDGGFPGAKKRDPLLY